MSFIKKIAAALFACAVTLPIAGQYGTLPANQAAAAPDEYHDDWLHVNENAEIVDMYGNPVWLTGCNWFGYNVGSQVFDGERSINMHQALNEIADHGFNLLRVPMSTEIILQWKDGKPDPIIKINEWKNPELTEEGIVGGTPKYSFEIWNMAVNWCRENGIKIMMDIHSASTNAAGHQYPLWYDSNFSEQDWLDALAWFADYYKDDDTIIAIDLKNEPHGKKDDGTFAKWDGSSDDNNWRYAAEKGAKACLDQNPNLLIMVEGIEVYPKFEKGFDWNSNSTDYGHYGDPEYQPYHGAWWGGNFRGARDYPVDLGQYQSQLVYSPHDYGPLVHPQSWFHLEGEAPAFTSYDFDRESLLKEYWYDTWAYLVEENISPLLMGEWGGRIDSENDPSGANRHWMEVLRDYMIEKRIHHTFWCFNENSSDTGGLVYDNFGVWDDVKYDFIKSAIWQDENGVFISLDHRRPIGANGQSLSDYYGGGNVHTTPKETMITQPDLTTTQPYITTTTPDDTTKQPVGDTKWGDVDDNKAVDVADAVLMARFCAEDKEVKVSAQGKQNADVSGDGDLTTDDLSKLLLYLANMLTAEELAP
jgi:aryl-phospho-beta-D-glucosidase BglC (GH1 family)